MAPATTETTLFVLTTFERGGRRLPPAALADIVADEKYQNVVDLPI